MSSSTLRIVQPEGSSVRTSSIQLGSRYCIATPEQARKIKERESTKHKKGMYLAHLEAAPNTTFGICTAIGISRGTYYYWRDHDPEFKAAVDRISSLTTLDVESTLYRKALQGNVAACTFILKHKHPDYMAPPKVKLLESGLEEEFESNAGSAREDAGDNPFSMK